MVNISIYCSSHSILNYHNEIVHALEVLNLRTCDSDVHMYELMVVQLNCAVLLLSVSFVSINNFI
jgi:hypothetical protein